MGHSLSNSILDQNLVSRYDRTTKFLALLLWLDWPHNLTSGANVKALASHHQAVGNTMALGGVVTYRLSAAKHKWMMEEATKTVMARGGTGSAGHSEIRAVQLMAQKHREQDPRRLESIWW